MIVENISYFSVGVCCGAIRMLKAVDTRLIDFNLEFTHFQNMTCKETLTNCTDHFWLCYITNSQSLYQITYTVATAYLLSVIRNISLYICIELNVVITFLLLLNH